MHVPKRLKLYHGYNGTVTVLHDNANFKDISNSLLALCCFWVSRGSNSGHVCIKLQLPLEMLPGQ